MISENELWMLSFYRLSEINGAQFFAKLAGSMRDEAIRFDMTRHFSEEAQHAWYWTDCIRQLDCEPLNIGGTYQDRYLSEIGLPANVMEVLALTQVFERRVINHYARQSRRPDIHPAIQDTLTRIMGDEYWHLEWVSKALERLEPRYGKDQIEATLHRYWSIDKAIYQRLLSEHAERLAFAAPELAEGDIPC